VTKTLPLALIALGVFTPGAHAVDWTVRSTLTETVEASDNRRLVVNPKGPSYSSFSSLLFDALARTPTSRFNLTGNLSYSAYAGPGETDTVNALNNNVTARYEHSTKLSNYFVTASRSESETSQIQLEETGVSTLNGSTISTIFSGGFRYDLTRRDTLAWQTSFSTNEFTGSLVPPVKNITSSVNYSHRANPLMTMTSSLQFQNLIFDNPANPDTTIWQATVGMQTQLTRHFGIQGTIGTTVRDGGSTPIPTSASASGSGLIFNASMNYRIIRFLEATLAMSRSTAPTTFGQIQSSDTVSGALRYTINENSSALLSGSYSTVSGDTGSFNALNASASYTRRLARGLQSALSYRYFERDSGGTTARSNTVSFSLTWDVTVLP
jgi:hypothetical protein